MQSLLRFSFEKKCFGLKTAAVLFHHYRKLEITQFGFSLRQLSSDGLLAVREAKSNSENEVSQGLK